MEKLDRPNDSWSKESLEFFDKLSKLTGDWTRVKGVPATFPDGTRNFMRAVGEAGKGFEYAFFCSRSLQALKGVAQCGIYTRGPVSIVHGGAVAALHDSAMGVCAAQCGYPSFTANLNVDFIRPWPIHSTGFIEANVDKVEGRKIFLSAAIKSVDESVTYSKATSLYIRPQSSGL